MKNLNLTVLSTALFILPAVLIQAQTIRRVNNDPGVTGANIYATIQDAHDAASNGDIILVEPSETTYGSLKCAKNLKIYGNGYFLDKNGGNMKANTHTSKLDYVDFVPGSSGSEIYGCQLSSVYIEAVSNIAISRNYITSVFDIDYTYTPPVGPVQYASVSNVIFSQNYATNVTIGGGSSYFISDVSINNNFLWSITATSNISSLIIRHNTIWPSSIQIQNTVFENNLVRTNTTSSFDTVEPVSGSFTAVNSSLNYNVNSGNLFAGGLGTGNQNTVDYTEHVIDLAQNASDDMEYKISDDSPLKTAGSGGTEVGMFGGPTPYIISGIPAIPSVTNLRTTGTGSNDTPITVTFSAKSNN